MRKNRVLIKEQLSNEQWLMMYFYRSRVKVRAQVPRKVYPDTKVVYLWTVGVYIGDSVKAARKWFNLSDKTKYSRQLITGKGDLEGLRKAMNHLINFCNKMQQREELHVYAVDDRRYKAYRYLMRFNGFVKNDKYYSFRHPNWWYWNENKAL